jgi:hypothetical protein
VINFKDWLNVAHTKKSAYDMRDSHGSYGEVSSGKDHHIESGDSHTDVRSGSVHYRGHVNGKKLDFHFDGTQHVEFDHNDPNSPSLSHVHTQVRKLMKHTHPHFGEEELSHATNIVAKDQHSMYKD